ncbi:hypothetical protein U9M48_042025 [Paspalum notatum var. saurae]|uniref:CCHC-type domain-containing protein n=1 Tax=Paspalum notatum var. saurae TaxID=547442 RepID=A0AAQ3UQ19_PASNO
MSSSPLTPESSRAAAERVVTSSGSVELLLLTKGNYHEWALVMQVCLEAMEPWDAVEKTCVERARDQRALAAILRAEPADMKAGLAVKVTAKEAWEAVRSMRVGDDLVKQASKQRLWKEFENFKFRDGECVDDVAVHVNAIVASLRKMGETLEDHRVVEKLLRVVPKKFKHVAVAIEMLTDLKTATIEEFVGRLRVAKDADKEDAEELTEQGGARLYRTEEQWEARHRKRIREQRHAGDARRGNGGGDGRRSGGKNRGNGGKNRGNGGSGDDDDGSDGDDEASNMCSGRSRRGGRPRCFECGKRGHFARECRDCKNKKEITLLGGADAEPTLL